MSHFIGFAIPGIPNGCTFALFAIGLILTYQATGVFNFAFAAQAYVSAFVYAYLTQHNWPVGWAFVVSVVLLAPALGLALDRFLFRRIPNTNSTAKVVTGISLLVGIPSLLIVFFGNQQLQYPPSLLFNADTVYFHLFGASDLPINGIDIGTVLVTAVVLIAMVILLRFTPIGLQMRGAVESRRLVQLDGVNANRVVAVAWAVSSFLAGLAGVLFAHQLAPIQADNYTVLMITAVAAAAWGVLRSMTIATLVAILLGVIESVAPAYLNTSGFINAVIVPVVPMIALALALLFVPGMRSLDDSKDPLAGIDPPTPPTAAASRNPSMDRIIRVAWYCLLAGFIISMLTWMPITWEGVFNEGIGFSVIFLSITLITGMGGQLSLAQATLAGVGAFMMGQLFNHFGLNLLLGAVVGGVAAAAVAVILALLSLRLRGLGLALMTLAAAVFFDNGIFNQAAVSSQSGVSLIPQNQPHWTGPLGIFSSNGHALFIVSMITLVLITLAILQIRKGTIGHYLAAMRGSETGAAGIGINLTWQRVLIFALAGAVAGVGGTLFSFYQTNVTANYFNVEFSLVFVVVVVTTGVGTVEGAIQAGIGLTVTLQLVNTYLPGPHGGSSIVFVLFAFGALTYSAHPEGVLEYQKRRWTARFERLFFHSEPVSEFPAATHVLSGEGPEPTSATG